MGPSAAALELAPAWTNDIHNDDLMDGLLDKLLEAGQPAVNQDMDLDIFEGLYDVLQAPLEAPSVSELTVPGWGLPVQQSAPHQQVRRVRKIILDPARLPSPHYWQSCAVSDALPNVRKLSCALVTAVPAHIFTLLKVCPNRCSYSVGILRDVHTYIPAQKMPFHSCLTEV